MFHLLDIDTKSQLSDIDEKARKIADYVIKAQSTESPFEARHKVKGIYLSEKKADSSTKKKIFDIDESDRYTFFPHFGKIENQIHRILVCGKSGSGKSTVISWIMDEFALSYETCQQIIVSFVKVDPALDRDHHGRRALRLNLEIEPDDPDPELFSITPEFFKDSLVIFDDIERGTNKKVVKFLLNLRAAMMETSRHYKTNIVSVSHDLLGGPINKVVKMEATGVFLYPAFNQPHQSREYLKKYVGLAPAQIAEIMTSESRWTYINLNAPTYYITEKRVKLLV